MTLHFTDAEPAAKRPRLLSSPAAPAEDDGSENDESYSQSQDDEDEVSGQGLTLPINATNHSFSRFFK